MMMTQRCLCAPLQQQAMKQKIMQQISWVQAVQTCLRKPGRLLHGQQ
jgi:hypothetical protein